MESKNTGNKWAAKPVCNFWEIQYDSWQHRISVLLDTPLVEILKGTLSLDRSLRNVETGIDWFFDGAQSSLPADITSVMKGTVTDKKGCLVLVRRTRQNLGDSGSGKEFLVEKSKRGKDLSIRRKETWKYVRRL